MRNLNVKLTNGIKAPHKAIMLISIMDLIKDRKITSNKIFADELLAESFQINWNKYVSDKSIFSHFKCSIWTPFWHMKYEPFWHFHPLIRGFNVDTLVPPGQTASIGIIRDHILYSYLDNDLFELLQDSEYREKMREILIETFILQPSKKSPTIIADDVSCFYDSNELQQEEISFIFDKSHSDQLIAQILKMDGVIKIVQRKVLPFIYILCISSIIILYS